MNPLLAVLVTGVAMFAAHVLVILLFREKPAAPEEAPAEAGTPARASGRPPWSKGPPAPPRSWRTAWCRERRTTRPR